ncbi:NUDIX hydrolase [Paenibacillus crassostreae]|uniref:Phosphohydrolase n=1 Tax=Paenibacillus crassostreae TaxID=1763538 RepID=A0A167FC04_9BACL|nr:NUDIX hydrolase [Paenibacillus crassostreae]AOZ90839.1 phosphohydrolase [Paenibacillus crassostreae]OAB76395.1 phosphohydrolase [Paenibacillus crassostreae]
MFYVNTRAIIERKMGAEIEIVIQNRNKANEPITIELPGGRIEPFESLTQALRREVKEETGLDLIVIEEEDLRIVSEGVYFEVECIQPFVAFQTIKGPVDSVGYYFRCKAEGELLDSGDETTDIRWINIKDLKVLLEDDPRQFSDVDRAGIEYYLKHIERNGCR